MIAWTLLALVMLRATIPVGFMPDLEALRDGRIEIVVCTPGGLKTIAVPADAAGPAGSEDGSSKEATSHECPFDAVVSQAVLLSGLAADLGRSDQSADQLLPGRIGTRTVRHFGPPLGSRAPPGLTL
ncbi:MAG: hypothetical protein P1U88_00930 [Thalassobaculaceae bacterium]|nr:hypothetical protein [Thalassobaculaceae bacterium]